MTVKQDDAQKALISIVQWLTLLRGCTRNNGIPEGYTYAGVGDFLLQHGVWYEPRALPRSIRPAAPRQCFGNALVLGFLRGLRYVEGYAVPDIGDVSMPMHHAWNINADGMVIDATWRRGGLAYLGVEFSLGRAENAIWFDDGSVLDNPHDRFRIFERPWQGETQQAWRRSNKVRRMIASVQREQGEIKP